MTQTSSEKRQEIERKVVRWMIRNAKKNGWHVPFVWDGEERVNCASEKNVMDAVFAVDEAKVYFRKNEGDKAHCVVIVLGNGFECLADASEGEEFDKEVSNPAFDYAETLDPRA